MLQKIEIDWEIHKLIEAERKGFEEPPYFALRRLLGLSSLQHIEKKAEVSDFSKDAWIEDGVIVPHGSDARMKYLRGTQVYEGKFLDGKLVVNGQYFDKLSPATLAFAVKRNGSKADSLNGWNYWEVKFPGERKWQKLWDIREKERKKLKLDLSGLDLEF